MWNLVKLAWRSLWRHKRRTIITVVAIAFALSITVFFITFAEGVYAQMINEAVRMQAGHITLEHPEYRDAPAIDLVVKDAKQLRQKIAALPEVEHTKLLIQGQGVAKSGRGAVGVGLMGVEPEVEAQTSPLAKKIESGEFLEEGDGRKVIIGKTLAERLKLEIGDKMVVTSNDADGDLVEQLLRVKGVFATGAPEVDGYLILVPLQFAQRLYRLDADEVTQLGVVLHDAGEREAVIEKVRQMTGYAVLTWQRVLPDLAAYVRIDRGSNVIMQGILIFLSLFTIFNTILMSVLERTREFAVLLALGTPAWRIRSQVVLESAFIGLIGCAAGLFIGGSAGYWVEVQGIDLAALYDQTVTVSGLALDSRVYADVTPGRLALLGGIVFSATILASVFTVRRVSRIDVAGVLR